MVFISFVTDKDSRGQNVLLEPDLQLRECSSMLHKSTCSPHQDICEHFEGWLELIGSMCGSLKEEIVKDKSREGLVVVAAAAHGARQGLSRHRVCLA